MTPNRDKAVLYPQFAEQLADFESRLAVAELPFFMFEGLRSFEQQGAYYAIGRTKPGQPCRHKGDPAPRKLGSCPAHRLGLTVTRAQPGLSFHAYGVAADFVLDGTPDKPSLDWSWNLKADTNADGRPDYLQMVEVAEACGLESAWRWKGFPEAPHVQNAYGHTVRECLRIYKEGGLPAVWAAFDEIVSRGRGGNAA